MWTGVCICLMSLASQNLRYLMSCLVILIKCRSWLCISNKIPNDDEEDLDHDIALWSMLWGTRFKYVYEWYCECITQEIL